MWATTLQRIVVAPNEQVRETPYIVHNIAATRKAYGIDRVDERPLTGDAVSSARQAIARNAETLDNVRLWDHQPLLDTFGQIQEIRTYYDFVSVDNDRYVIDGRYRQVMLSARELNSESLPNRSWINERLTFTHGYGVTLGPVNQVNAEGLPELFIRNLPPESSVDLPRRASRASTSASCRTTTSSSGHGRASSTTRAARTTSTRPTTATAGHPGRRVLAEAALQSALPVAEDPAERRPHARAAGCCSDVASWTAIGTIAPFLVYDRDPYLVISAGRLFWIVDAYTVTDRYPYSAALARPVSTTSGTRSRSWSTPTTGTTQVLRSPTRAIRSR